MMHLLAGFLHLRELDITVYTEANAELLLAVVQKMAKTCGTLRSVRWNAKTRVSNDILGEDVFQIRVHHYELTDGVWNMAQEAGKTVVYESTSRESAYNSPPMNAASS
ncbi:hypothetical protein FRB97_006186 [Tulasnella sp. 331]|nr:hypothetical protein FRB97_006186 [Tulasnella sp. 331]